MNLSIKAQDMNYINDKFTLLHLTLPSFVTTAQKRKH